MQVSFARPAKVYSLPSIVYYIVSWLYLGLFPQKTDRQVTTSELCAKQGTARQRWASGESSDANSFSRRGNWHTPQDLRFHRPEQFRICSGMMTQLGRRTWVLVNMDIPAVKGSNGLGSIWRATQIVDNQYSLFSSKVFKRHKPRFLPVKNLENKHLKTKTL
ncbi:hypothetical protein F4803DRAFT_534401 [Xylaria telfairii]|nr:hypothetical protein F4803DRAFT_534401 [Xylaria telfairii]